MRSPADELNRAMLGARDPAARAELENFAFGVVGGINPAARGSKAGGKAVANLAETGYASGVPPQGVVMPKGRAGKMNTVAAVKAAQAHYGREAVEARANAEIARRGAAGNVDMEKAAIEQAARDMASEIPRTDPANESLEQVLGGRDLGELLAPTKTPKAPPKPPPVKTPALMVGDRIFTTPNSTHAGIVRELSKKKDIDPEDLATAVNNMDEFFGYLDGKRNFLKRPEAGARRVARGEPVNDPNDFDSFELPNILRDFGGPTIVKEVNPLKIGTLAKQLLATIQDNKAGFSVQLKGKALTPATTGYAVGAGGVNKNTLTVPLDKLNLRSLTKWMKANPDAWRKGVLGGWVDDAGNAVIEPSTLVDDFEGAFQLGKERGEQAIGDLATYARGQDGTIPLSTSWLDKHQP